MPGNTDSTVRLAETLLLQGKYQAAVEIIDENVVEPEENVDALVILSQSLLGSKRYGDAKEAASRLVNLLPQSADAHSLLGWALLRTGDSSDALHEFAKATMLDSETPHHLAGKACALRKLHRHAEADAIFEKLSRVHPDYFEQQPEIAQFLERDDSGPVQ
jgi:Flp pilus assembly protein TadD